MPSLCNRIIRQDEQEKSGTTVQEIELRRVELVGEPGSTLDGEQGASGPMMQEVERERQALLREMEGRAAQVLAQAREEGYQAGYQKGYEEGLFAGQREGDELRSRAQTLMREVDRECRAAWKDLEQETLKTAISLAEKIMHRQVSLEREVLISLAKEALQMALEAETYTIYGHPGDIEFLRNKQNKLLAEAGRNIKLRLVGDPNLTPGGVVLDTEIQSIEVSLDGQLSRLRQIIFGEAQDETA